VLVPQGVERILKSICCFFMFTVSDEVGSDGFAHISFLAVRARGL